MKRSESVMTGSDGNASNETKKKFVTNFTKYSLLNAIKDKSMIISKEETFTVIKDKYPKSRHHYLVVANERLSAEEVSALKSRHIQLIDEMQTKAKLIAKQMDISAEFRYGFHLIPSLKPLHLHIISQDFDSKYLKTKKHYNSFTTQFFIDSQTVIENLKKYGKIETKPLNELEALLKQDMVCHFCRIKVENIPKLKTHLQTHYPKTDN